MFLAILHHYLIWHYSRGFLEWFHVWGNLLWFIVHFFSLPLMVRSWLSPWKRMTEPRQKAWDIEDWASSLFINILSRFIGAIMRTIMILVGLFALVLLLAAGTLITLGWAVAPALIILLLILGVSYIV